MAECRKADAEALAVLARGPAERRDDKNPAALDAINELLRRALIHDKAHEAGRLEMLEEIDPQGNTVRQCEKCGETYTIIPGGDDSCPNDECQNHEGGRGNFSMPLAKELITPRAALPKRSRITDPRYQISTLILEASRRKDPKAMQNIEPDALADVIFTALKRTHPLYRVAADALDALRTQTYEYDCAAKRDPRPRSRRFS